MHILVNPQLQVLNRKSPNRNRALAVVPSHAGQASSCLHFVGFVSSPNKLYQYSGNFCIDLTIVVEFGHTSKKEKIILSNLGLCIVHPVQCTLCYATDFACVSSTWTHDSEPEVSRLKKKKLMQEKHIACRASFLVGLNN